MQHDMDFVEEEESCVVYCHGWSHCYKPRSLMYKFHIIQTNRHQMADVIHVVTAAFIFWNNSRKPIFHLDPPNFLADCLMRVLCRSCQCVLQVCAASLHRCVLVTNVSFNTPQLKNGLIVSGKEHNFKHFN